MGAVTIVPDPAGSDPGERDPDRMARRRAWRWRACLILLLACAALVLDLRDRRRAEFERERLRSLANAAVEGLVVCRGDTDRQRQRRPSPGWPALEAADLAGAAPGARSCRTRARLALVGNGRPAGRGRAHARRTAAAIPVEVIMRPVAEYGRQPHYAVAIRDLLALAAGRRGAIRLPRAPRSIDRTSEQGSPFNARLEQDIEAARASGGRQVSCTVPRPRPLQGGQRSLRPRGRRHFAPPSP